MNVLDLKQTRGENMVLSDLNEFWTGIRFDVAGVRNRVNVYTWTI